MGERVVGVLHKSTIEDGRGLNIFIRAARGNNKLLAFQWPNQVSQELHPHLQHIHHTPSFGPAMSVFVYIRWNIEIFSYY